MELEGVVSTYGGGLLASSIEKKKISTSKYNGIRLFFFFFS